MLQRLLACLVVVVALLAAPFPAPAQPAAASAALPAGVQKVRSVEGINEYQLPNGLRVLLYPDASKPTVTVNITYLVGSRHEGYGETGMAHLLADDGQVEARGRTLPDLDVALAVVLSAHPERYPSGPLEVRMTFDNSVIPQWIRQYSNHYFNRVVTLRLSDGGSTIPARET